MGLRTDEGQDDRKEDQPVEQPEHANQQEYLNIHRFKLGLERAYKNLPSRSRIIRLLDIRCNFLQGNMVEIVLPGTGLVK